MAYTAETSDVPVFLGRLENDAKHGCKVWAKKEKIDCTCQMLDKNGKNVLRQPK